MCASVPGVSQAVGPNDPMPPLDYHAHLMSLAAILETTPQSIPGKVPFLVPDPGLVEQWRQNLAHPTKMKIGIAWGCNPKPLPTRACPLENWAPLGKVPSVSFYVLQKGEPAKQAATPPEGLKLVDLTFGLDDFADTAALIANLDLIISVDTSVAHVAGGMGKPVWVLIPLVSDWRWMLGRTDSPWYPTLKLYRQEQAGDWPGVMRQVEQDLRKVVLDDCRGGELTDEQTTQDEIAAAEQDLRDAHDDTSRCRAAIRWAAADAERCRRHPQH